jgi:hypothetical protein
MMDFQSGHLFLHQEEHATVSGVTPSARILASAHPLFRLHDLAIPPDQKVSEALDADAVARRILAKGARPVAGTLVGVRLSLNILKARGIAVQTLHTGNDRGGHRKNKGFYNGSVLDYRKAVSLKAAYFNVSQSGREKIASGQDSKHPMASVDGELVDTDGPSQVWGVEVRFNPFDVHCFVDLNNRPIWYASEVLLVGHRAYCRGEIVFHTHDTAPPKVGNASSAVIF